MAPVLFQIVSDLHLETHPSYDSYKLPQTAPYLALLGDIGHVNEASLFAFLEKQLHRYWAVFYLIGNHEPKGLTLADARARVRAFAARMDALRARSTVGRFVFLERARYDLTPGVTVLGCTLFSRVRPDQAAAVQARLVDLRDTREWAVAEHNRAHAADLEWLNDEVARLAREEPERRVAVFTHHSPCGDDPRATNPRHEGSEVSSGFATDLRGEVCWAGSNVTLWAFGHTHWNCNFVVEESEARKTVLANQKGYSRMVRDDFNAKKIFEVG